MATENKTSSLKICRYCLTNSTEHIVEYFVSDEQDKYEKLLEDTFNIQICVSDNKILCLECKEDFRNAAEVKKRILDVQKTLLEKSEKLNLLENETLKEEIDSDYKEWGFDYGDTGENGTRASDTGASGRKAGKTSDLWTGSVSDSDCSRLESSGAKTMYVILGSETPKREIDSNCEDCCSEDIVLDGGTGNDGTGDGGTGAAGKECGDNGEMQIDGLIVKKAFVKIERMKNGVPTRSEGKTMTEVSDAMPAVNKVKLVDIKKSHKRNCNPYTTPKSLIQKRKNTPILLSQSNMCLFTSKKNKYGCYFCSDSFLEMQNLRAHSLTHKTDKLRHSILQSRGQTLKAVDISNLACKKCWHPCKDLDELRVHLKNNHDEAFEGTDHMLLPFKIKDGFVCVICQEEFLTFLRLFIHMNCHANCNVCEMCGVSFKSGTSLKNHIKAVHTMTRCTVCPAVFPTMAAKAKHLRTTHNKGGTKRYCTHCDMTFRHNYKLKEHMIEKHGAKKTVNVCEHCHKEFASASGVKTHFKAVHLGERKHVCSICNMSFFTSFDRNRHEKTHGSGKPFSCGFCDAKFRSKDSVQRHLKKKHGGAKNV